MVAVLYPVPSFLTLNHFSPTFIIRDRQIKLLMVEKPFDTSEKETFVSELTPVKYSVGSGVLGTSGNLGVAGKMIEAPLQGDKCRFGIGMHPPSDGDAFAEYALPEVRLASSSSSSFIKIDVKI
jgi:hypothetical protein